MALELGHGLTETADWSAPVSSASFLHLHLDTVAVRLDDAPFFSQKPDVAGTASGHGVRADQDSYPLQLDRRTDVVCH